MLTFIEMCEKIWKSQSYKIQARGNIQWLPERILALDPGHTTGYAMFNRRCLIAADQVATPPNDFSQLNQRLKEFNEFNPELVIIEDYKVYANKVDQHSNMDLWVPKLVGIFSYHFEQMLGAHICLQMAREVKSFSTDQKLKDWQFYEKGRRHANDAIRHATHWLLFKGYTNAI